MTVRVPFVDLGVQHQTLMPELMDAFRKVTECSAFAGGPFVARFESEFAAYCHSRYALGVGSGTKHVFHICAVRVQDRDGVLQRMAAHGVNCAVHYPLPIHRQKAYSFLGLGPGSFPVAERCSRELLSLPMYPELRPEEIEFVVEVLKKSLRN